jgi:hypothetical protein
MRTNRARVRKVVALLKRIFHLTLCVPSGEQNLSNKAEKQQATQDDIEKH